MALKELMALENPTIEECREIEELLMEIARDSQLEINDLDNESRARGKDRLLGLDDGSKERELLRIVAVQRLQDAGHELDRVRSRVANEQTRIAKEADEEAWRKVHEYLRLRREAMIKISELCSEIGPLFEEVIDHGTSAYQGAPVKPDVSYWNATVGFRPDQIAVAIMSKLHSLLGRPLAAMNMGGTDMVNYEFFVNTQGLSAYLNDTDKAILAAER